MDHSILISELQALVTESKRRNPEVKDAGEKALELLKGGPKPKGFLLEHSDDLLSPFYLGCKTKVAKIIGISIAALQRLVALGGVPTASLLEVLQTLTTVSNQAVDIQLKILQALLSILTFNQDVHDEILGQALLLCFKLQDSRVSVVSSTAAATLRQAVMLIFDRISSLTSNETTSIPLTLAEEPPIELNITPSAMDAYNVLADLCILTGGGGTPKTGGSEKNEGPKLLKLSSLQRTFGLELIESILSGYEESVKQHPELLFLVRHSLAPLLLKLQADKPTFPIALRVCRLIFLLIRSFMDQIPSEVENFLGLLIRMGMGDFESEEGSKKETTAPWLRVLALEIIRGMCGDPILLQKLYEQYDQREQGRTPLFQKLVSALSRLMNEKPNLLGIGTQMYGLGVPSADTPTNSSGYFDMGLGIVASAASAGVNTVSSMMGTTGGLGHNSGMKLRLIEQHDKAEAPVIPETYIFLLALGSLDSIAEAIFTTVAQITATPPAIRGMADSAWPALLAALSYCIGTNLTDPLFSEVLAALQDFTVACGLLGLNTPRDAFLATLGKYAVPPPVVSAMQTYLEAPPVTRNNSVMGAGAAETLGLTALGVGIPTGPPSLSERNLACLRATVTAARILSGSLGEAWHDVLEILQNANFLLASKRSAGSSSTKRGPLGVTSPSLGPPSPGRPRPSSEGTEDRSEVFNDLDTDSIQSAINILFDGTKEMDDTAFSTFISALCRLSSEMIGIGISETPDPAGVPPSPMSANLILSPVEYGSRRRTSGLNVSNSIRSGERSFSLTKLRSVAVANLPRLVNNSPEVGWNVITHHLLSVARHSTASSAIRMQATETLGELLLSAIRIGKESKIQHQVFEVLGHQVDINPISSILSVDYDVRSAGYQILNNILESSGHSLEVGWQTIFNMLDSVCRDTDTIKRSDSTISVASTRPSTFVNRGNAALVRIAFPSLNLICTDFLSSLDSQAMRQCIACLGHYGKQKDDVNITLAAIGLLWNVSDVVQGSDKELWLYLLTELLELSQDSRLDVRSSAMQTLFRCIELYGSGLSQQLWLDVIWKITFPLLDNCPPDESQILALTSIGGIFSTFLQSISSLSGFNKIYHHLLERLEYIFSNAPPACCTAALKALERILIAIDAYQIDNPEEIDPMLEAIWKTFTSMGIRSLSSSTQQFSQDNLVALVRIATLLQNQYTFQGDTLKQLSTILRSIMTYSKSTDYRPDVDVMSPLQTAVAELVANSSGVLGASIVLTDLAEYGSLAYLGDAGRVSYVALSKYCMPKMGEVFDKSGGDPTLYEDGTVESIIAAYSIPIRLKYDCPAPSKYGKDPPLWRIAMTSFSPVLEKIMRTLDTIELSSERYEAIWAQILDTFAAILLSDTGNTPPSTLEDDESFILPLLGQMKDCFATRLANNRVPIGIIEKLGENLRKASRLYHYENPRVSGTTAPVIEDGMEKTRYWAFGMLIELATRHSFSSSDGNADGVEDGRKRIAKGVAGALMLRFEDAMKEFLEDARLRGQMPFGRIREEEILYVFRHLATIELWPNTLQAPSKASPVLISAYKTSSRAHLFRLWKLILDTTMLQTPLPRMWIFPSEYHQLLDRRDIEDSVTKLNGSPNGMISGLTDGREDDEVEEEMNAGDGTDLIEIGVRELGKRCLELFGEEMMPRS